MIRLKPLVETPEMYEALEEQLLAAIRRLVYLPLLREITEHDADAEAERRLMNAKSAVVAAVGSGEIQYTSGRFEGRFRAALSRELREMGATYNGRRRCWTIAFGQLPVEVRLAIATAQSRFRAMAERANRALRGLAPAEIASQIDLAAILDASVFQMDRQFRRNVEKIGIVPELDDAMRAHIAREYTRSTALDIEGWARRDIDSLRKAVVKNTFQYGLRREALLKNIESRYKVSARKARFLARQETSLIMAKFQQRRYDQAGVKRYEWVCVNNPPAWITGPRGGRRLAPHSVRPDHWELNHSIQLWSSPPVVDKASGRRRHPKEDYNCRCTAIPIVE